jgi:acetyltransferase EpsM
MNKVSLYGASGHAKVILDIIISIEDLEIAFIFDDNPSVTHLRNHLVLNASDYPKEFMRYPLLLSIGDNSIREHLVQRLNPSSFSRALVHSSAHISEEMQLHKGSVIMPMAVISASTKIGQHCILNTGAVIEHDCNLEDFVHVSPNATVCGGVSIGKGTHIGAGAIIIPQIKIGEHCIIGAGTVVINDIPSHSKVVGNPGRIL